MILSHFSLCFTVFTSPFVSLMFWSFRNPRRSAILIWYGRWVMVSRIHLCGLSISSCWRDSIFFLLNGLHSSIRIGVMQPLFLFFFFLLCWDWSIQVVLVTLDWLPGHNIEIPTTSGILFLLFYVRTSNKLYSLAHCVFDPYLEVTIWVVHVGIFLDIGVGIHRGYWGHSLPWRGQHFLDDHSSSLFWCHSICHHPNQHPQGNISYGFYEILCMFFFTILDPKIISHLWKFDWYIFLLQNSGRVSELLVSMWC